MHGVLCSLSSCTNTTRSATKNATTTLCHAPIRDESNKIRITNIVVAAVSAACMLLRIAFKISTVGFGELGLDDYAVFAATLVGVPTVIIIDRGIVPNGLAQDVWTVPFDKIYNFAFWLYVLEIIYFALIAMVKLTLLFFFLRIFPKPLIRRLIWATIIIDVLYGLSFALVAAFQCQPISHYWVRLNCNIRVCRVLTFRRLGGILRARGSAGASTALPGVMLLSVSSSMSGCSYSLCTKFFTFNCHGETRSVSR